MDMDAVIMDADGQAPEANLAREEAILTRKLRMLEDFVKTSAFAGRFFSVSHSLLTVPRELYPRPHRESAAAGGAVSDFA